MKKTLVVLAAGMGSRFGGFKQIEAVGPNGEFIIDYSVYDAKMAGFQKIVFVIKKEIEEVFKETIGKRLENHIEVCYAFQEMDDVPLDVSIPRDRVKPLGTGHALYVAKNLVNEPFALISADDFYGREPFYLLSEFLEKEEGYAVIGYKIGDALTNAGAVKRGVCFTDSNGNLTDIVESLVEQEKDAIYGTPLMGGDKYKMANNHPVSMLMYGLRPNIFPVLEKEMVKCFNSDKDIDKKEFLLPMVLDKMMKEKEVNIKVIPTNAKWYGITYKEDLNILKENINKLIEEGVYPKKLW